MKKLFISQPMKGKTDEQILAEREQAIEAAKKLVGEEVEIIDSFFQAAPADAKPLWFLGKVIGTLVIRGCCLFCTWLESIQRLQN